MNARRFVVLLGVLLVLHGIGYFLLAEWLGAPGVLDAAGAVLLVALGLAMCFGGYVIVNGARDL
jgi:hypothetical protein